MNLLENEISLTDLENEFIVTSVEKNGAGDRLRVWDWHVQIATYKIDNQ